MATQAEKAKLEDLAKRVNNSARRTAAQAWAVHPPYRRRLLEEVQCLDSIASELRTVIGE